MIYLVLSIICSVSVGIIFKAARRYDTCNTQMVAWNYVFAILLCYLFFSPDLSIVNASVPWHVYIPLMILMPTIFIMLAKSIKYIGIVKTDSAQRLSLFIPLLAAWLIFNESFNAYKIAGIAVAFPAILLILSREDKHTEKRNWLFPVLVLLGFGVIDVLFKHIALTTGIATTTSMFIVFCGALAVMALIVLYQIAIVKIPLKLMSVAFGALVGIFNFGNILFYIKAHEAFKENPSTVFAAMNMGVIILGSVAGVAIFKEKLSKWNYFGIFLALVAITLITLSQIQSN